MSIEAAVPDAPGKPLLLSIVGVASLALIPWLLCEALTRTILRATPASFVASSPNDLPEYWHEIATFRAVGFAGGYFAAREVPPPATFTHFGVHGPVFPIIFGSAARVFGWAHASPIYFNAAFLALALIYLCVQGNLDQKQYVAALALTLTFWPLHLLVPTTFQESFHLAAAIVAATVVYKRYVRPEYTDGRILSISSVVIMLGLCVLTLARSSWGFLFIPFCLAEAQRAHVRNFLVPCCLGLATAFTLVAVSTWMASPGANIVTSSLSTFGSLDILRIARVLVAGIVQILEFLNTSTLDVLQRLQIVAILIAVTVEAVSVKRRNALAWFHLYNLASILGAVLLVYLSAGFYRVLAVNLALSLYLMVLTKRFTTVAAVVATNVLVLWAMPQEYALLSPNFSVSSSHVTELETVFNADMIYDPEANPWCNTILTTTQFYDYRVSLVPPGFGISWLRPSESLDGPVRSRFLLLDPREVGTLKSDLVQIVTLPGEDLALYRNPTCG